MAYAIRNLSKRYGATLALDDVTMEFAPGEVHALLGHNGAGKSTIIRCLGGGVAPSAGTIEIDGTQKTRLTPRESRNAGVAIIYQHLSLVDPLTVAENIFLGDEHTRGGMIDRTRQVAESLEVLQRVGADFEPTARVGDLSMGARQLVEIAKALRREVKLLVLDEPTAALSPVESSRLGVLVERLRTEGIAIVYITHLLEEVMRLADRATVLQNGRAVWSSKMQGVSKADLVSAVGGGGRRERASAAQPGPAVLELEGFKCGSAPPVDMAAHAGEILGLYGLVGSGRTRLLETIFGARRQPAGRILVDGQEIGIRTPREALLAGIALVPGDRRRQGLFSTLSASDNVVMPAIARLARPFRARKGEQDLFNDAVRSLHLHPADPRLPAASFSGGNQQKLLIGRWLTAHNRVRVLLVDDPTQGVDVGAREEIYRVIRAAASRGIAVIIASNDPEELVAVAGRCLIFRSGVVTGTLDMANVDETTLLAEIHTDLAA